MLILNILLFETLKEIAKYEFTILRKFKEYSLSIKSRRKEVEGRNRGFATSPSEIRYFLDTITKYVVSQKFHVFYNLEIPNGPTALDMLKYMHSQSDESDDYDDDINTLVLPV